jgi:molybdate transport system substrate-binding protein
MRFACRLVALAAAFFLPWAASAQQLTVSAAASLTDAFKELGPRFEAARPGATVRFNFAASGVLLQQIGQGAPVDVFASADQETMNRANEQKLVEPATRVNFVSNSLVLIEPAQGGLGLKSLQDLSGPAVKRIAVGKVATVPVGRYTQQALTAANLWAPLEPKFVQGDSVRQVLDYVARGEVDAGFVYRTDAALMGDKVKIVLTASGSAPVTYPAAVVSDSRQKALARDFVTFLTSDAAQQVLVRYGFGHP